MAAAWGEASEIRFPLLDWEAALRREVDVGCQCVCAPRSAVILLALLAAVAPRPAAAAVQLGVRGVGLSLGNSPRACGLRINAVDDKVQRVDGLNLTLWNPRPSPAARMNGAAIGLIGPKAGRLQGLAVGGLGATASERIRGVAVAGFGVGTASLAGAALGGLLVDIKGESRGLLGALVACRARGSLDGIATGGCFVEAGELRGLALGGFGVVGRRGTGLALSPGIVGYSESLHGLALGGLVAGGGLLRGIVLSAGAVIAGKELRGLAVGGLGLASQGPLRGLGVGGLLLVAPELQGIGAGALNGVLVEDVNLEDFLKIRTVNRRTQGLQIGLVNYTAELRGVQIGLFNIAGNNPRWARVLPGLNLHW